VSVLAPNLRDLMLDPPRQTTTLAGIGGRLRARPEDFRVIEIPAYSADGTPDRHVLFRMTKRGLTTEDALMELCRGCSIPRVALGVAGLKDKDAVTQQFVSAPANVEAALANFSHPQIEVGERRPHSHKLRRGHLHGNRFDLVVRDLAMPRPEALARVEHKRAALVAAGGAWNLFGEQRFGYGAANVDRGVQVLSRARAQRRDQFVISALQSALFNVYLIRRAEAGLLRQVLEGDVLRKRETGGMFVCASAAEDQPRLDAGELEITGPIHGSKMRAAEAGSPAAELEAATLAEFGIPADAWRAMGKNAPGTRRSLQIDVEVEAGPADAVDDLTPGVRLRFALPAGSYATVLCSELQEGCE